MNRLLFISIFLLIVATAFGQTRTDTIKTRELKAVTVEGSRISQDIQRLEPIQGTYIYAGKKTEVIDMTQKNVAMTEKYGRQIFAKIPSWQNTFWEENLLEVSRWWLYSSTASW